MLEQVLVGDARMEVREDRALLALQGPDAVRVLCSIIPGVDQLSFMECADTRFGDGECRVSRLGYTGEDSFEIALPRKLAPQFAESLRKHEAVELAGLGARDSLRLEAGLSLYGHELDEETDPVSAGLAWILGKARLQAADFPGAAPIIERLDNCPRHLVGL